MPARRSGPTTTPATTTSPHDGQRTEEECRRHPQGVALLVAIRDGVGRRDRELRISGEHRGHDRPGEPADGRQRRRVAAADRDDDGDEQRRCERAGSSDRRASGRAPRRSPTPYASQHRTAATTCSAVRQSRTPAASAGAAVSGSVIHAARRSHTRTASVSRPARRPCRHPAAAPGPPRRRRTRRLAPSVTCDRWRRSPASPRTPRQRERRRSETRSRGHNERYFVLDDPVISDAEYDAALARAALDLEARFPSLVTPGFAHPATRRSR